jgi:hypothetical protein
MATVHNRSFVVEELSASAFCKFAAPVSPRRGCPKLPDLLDNTLPSSMYVCMYVCVCVCIYMYVKVKVKSAVGAFYSTTAYGLLYSWPLKEFLHSSLEALHTSGVQRPQLVKEGTIEGMYVCMCSLKSRKTLSWYSSVSLTPMHTLYTKYNLPSNIKGKFHPVTVMKPQRGSRAIAILFR